METMGAGGQDSTAASGASAPIVHCHFNFKLIVVFFVVPTAIAVSQPPPPLPQLPSLSLSPLLSLSLSLPTLSLSSLLSLSLSLPSSSSLLSLSPPPSPLPPLPQLPSPSPPEHSRFFCCCGAHPLPARDLPRCCAVAVAVSACHQHGIAVIARACRQGVAPRRE